MRYLLTNDYYVYVYIDPRNLEEFYYGKGRGSRKEIHLFDQGDSEKAKRIRDIQREGLAPDIRVIAAGLSEQEALLVETTLIWKLGKFTTNLAAGHFSGKFRPHNTLHRRLSGFDFRNRIYYFNLGDDGKGGRVWEDCRRIGFITAGGDPRWRDPMLGFEVGDLAAAYLKGHGFVGIARILERAAIACRFQIDGKGLGDLGLASTGRGFWEYPEDPDRAEYLCRVEWLASVPRDRALPARRRDVIYTTTHVRANLDGQLKTIEYLEKGFDVPLRDQLM